MAEVWVKHCELQISYSVPLTSSYNMIFRHLSRFLGSIQKTRILIINLKSLDFLHRRSSEVYINICWHSVKSCYVYVLYTRIIYNHVYSDDCIVSVSVNETIWKHCWWENNIPIARLEQHRVTTSATTRHIIPIQVFSEHHLWGTLPSNPLVGNQKINRTLYWSSDNLRNR
jgi:hypothetical protein